MELMKILRTQVEQKTDQGKNRKGKYEVTVTSDEWQDKDSRKKQSEDGLNRWKYSRTNFFLSLLFSHEYSTFPKEEELNFQEKQINNQCVYLCIHKEWIFEVCTETKHLRRNKRTEISIHWGSGHVSSHDFFSLGFCFTVIFLSQQSWKNFTPKIQRCLMRLNQSSTSSFSLSKTTHATFSLSLATFSSCGTNWLIIPKLCVCVPGVRHLTLFNINIMEKNQYVEVKCKGF